MKVATQEELDVFLEQNPKIQMLEVLMPDINGVLRCKRIHRREFGAMFSGGIKSPACLPLVNCKGDLAEELNSELFIGDPDQLIKPVSGSLALVPWLSSPTAQVLVGSTTLDGEPAWVDPRNVLDGVLEKFRALNLKPVVATEMEFYLVANGDGERPAPLLAKVPGTSVDQAGVQYCVAQDLWQFDGFLDDVRTGCDAQGVPLTVIHSEFSPGQWEINTHHVDDPMLACDHAAIFKRIIKGVAIKHGYSASFMAKPFTDIAGSGMHIHASVYDDAGNNIFSDPSKKDEPAISDAMLHAIGGLAQTMPDAMAVFAPNANSYRRFVPGVYAPTAATWGYNHREVSLRIPVSGDKDRRIEHRVAGADSNPYLVMAMVLAGIHYGLTEQCDPGPGVEEETEVDISAYPGLPVRWEYALDSFRASKILPKYLTPEYFKAFAVVRQSESDEFNASVSNIDYEWYMRVV
jgi:glutamine synthetase